MTKEIGIYKIVNFMFSIPCIMDQFIKKYKIVISQKINTFVTETTYGENMKLLMKSRSRGENDGEMHIKE
jgi:hypothetical protein